jgi:hypothetical protein
MYFIFNESDENTPEEEVEWHLMHAMNWYVFGNLRGYEMKKGDNVRWHLIGMWTEVDIHTSHWHGEVVEYNGRNTDVVELLPASMKSVDMFRKESFMMRCRWNYMNKNRRWLTLISIWEVRREIQTAMIFS